MIHSYSRVGCVTDITPKLPPVTSRRHHYLARCLNTLRPRQNGRHFRDDIFKWIFLNGNIWISIDISLKFVAKGRINNILALVQIMAWRRQGDKSLFEPMMVSLLTHICVARPQWVNDLYMFFVYVKTLSTYRIITMRHTTWFHWGKTATAQCICFPYSWWHSNCICYVWR